MTFSSMLDAVSSTLAVVSDFSQLWAQLARSSRKSQDCRPERVPERRSLFLNSINCLLPFEPVKADRPKSGSTAQLLDQAIRPRFRSQQSQSCFIRAPSSASGVWWFHLKGVLTVAAGRRPNG